MKALLAVVLLAGLIGWAGPALGSECGGGQGTSLARAVQGPYRLAFEVAPAPPVLGEARLILEVCDATTGEPVRNAVVSLLPTAPDGRQGAAIYAFNRTSLPEYSADVRFREPGNWRYRVLVDGPQGSAVWETEVAVLSGRSEGTSGLVFLGTSAAVALGAAFLILSSRLRRAGFVPHT